MTKMEFIQLEFYEKLSAILLVCGYIQINLKNVENVCDEHGYINELVDELLDNFNIFIQDDDFVKDENFHGDGRKFLSLMNEVLEISQLIKLGSAYYGYLIDMLNEIIDILEKRLPHNRRMAKFLRKLLDYKTEFTKVMDVSEEEIEKVIGNMLAHVDDVEAIIKVSKEKVNVKK